MIGQMPRLVLFGFDIALIMRITCWAHRYAVCYNEAVFLKLGNLFGIVGDQPQRINLKFSQILQAGKKYLSSLSNPSA